MAGLRVFASHGGSILSRGWLATVEAPGYPCRHPPSTEVKQLVKHMQSHGVPKYVKFV